ncbi:RNA polymerase sigma-70 factor (ECF subfamily) [Dyadobacter jejuensis]|uniref:RNA polymerase sigma-70 factor (ECF subfamily) n=1 Tax=Dyadobacter jejuensis TaxID=1082580 RepID=A0A316AD09_9BACT|nr:sigma-70 family RNA polymerase sigma factor [Dyadobacter jejuensis]PWJ55623.1 RNA polymerase sigma-70 factor (ECF subfamily) [Dyadobacter jejuensis]
MSIYGDLNNEKLIQLLAVGDGSAFSELYRRNWKSMFDSAYKRLSDRDLCQDIVQNIFVDLWERKGQVEIGDVEAYLHTAVRFQVLKQITRKPEKSYFLDQLPQTLISTRHADDAVIYNELNGLLQAWIKALPPKRREIFLMHYFEGRNTSEIASSLDISQKTVQNQLHTATQGLKGHLTNILHILVCSALCFLE